MPIQRPQPKPVKKDKFNSIFRWDEMIVFVSTPFIYKASIFVIICGVKLYYNL